MAFTEFCCRSGGDNLNAGTLDGINEPAAAPLATVTGCDLASVTFLTLPVGTDMTSFVVGRWVSVVPDGTSGQPTSGSYLVGRITSVNTGTRILQLSILNFGTFQGNGTANKTVRVGGAWAGPSGSASFPMNFATQSLQNASGDRPRVNWKNDQTYAITASMTNTATTGPIKFQGYTTTFGDGGAAVIDGGTTGASYMLYDNGSLGLFWEDFVWQNNGATGSSSMVVCRNSGNGSNVFRRCVFKNSRGSGLDLGGGNQNIAIECLATNCNLSNTASLGGFVSSSSTGTVFIRCYSFGHTGSNAHGFVCNATNTIFTGCISFTNGGCGFFVPSETIRMYQCSAYNNGGDGARFTAIGGTAILIIENSDFVKNTLWGINLIQGGGGSNEVAILNNLGFGSGTQANGSGQINTSNTGAADVVDILGTVTYPTDATPWADPVNGDFRIVLPAAMNAGRGYYHQTEGGMGGTIGYPDIGAAQAAAALAGPVNQLRQFSRGAPY